jgi:hypothetical protein
VDFSDVVFGRLIFLEFLRETANILLYFLDGVLGHTQFKSLKESLEESLFSFPYCQKKTTFVFAVYQRTKGS